MAEIEYCAERDLDAESPLEWGYGGELVMIFSGYNSALDGLLFAKSPELQALYKVMKSKAAYFAYPIFFDHLKFAVKVVRRVFPDSNVFAEKVNDSGWAFFVGVGEVPLEAYKQWMLEDIWTVTKYEVVACDQGFQHKKVVSSLSGIYASYEDEAIEYFKENYDV